MPGKFYQTKFLRLQRSLQQIETDLVGQAPLKNQLASFLISYLFSESDRELPYLNMFLMAPPGSGKTFIAKYIGELFVASGMLLRNVFREATSVNLIAQYEGQTCAKVQSLLLMLRGVLFVDEMYTLTQSGYGKEAVGSMLNFMSEHKGNMMIIGAGYSSHMVEQPDSLIHMNPGLTSISCNFILTAIHPPSRVRL